MDTYKRAYRKFGNQGLFYSEDRASMLTSLGNPLERLEETVDFEMFRETLEAGLYRDRMTKAGAKPYDYVLMFKSLVLQRIYNLWTFFSSFRFPANTMLSPLFFMSLRVGLNSQTYLTHSPRSTRRRGRRPPP